jgi:hypothetical protein
MIEATGITHGKLLSHFYCSLSQFYKHIIYNNNKYCVKLISQKYYDFHYKILSLSQKIHCDNECRTKYLVSKACTNKVKLKILF